MMKVKYKTRDGTCGQITAPIVGHNYQSNGDAILAGAASDIDLLRNAIIEFVTDVIWFRIEREETETEKSS